MIEENLAKMKKAEILLSKVESTIPCYFVKHPFSKALDDSISSLRYAMERIEDYDEEAGWNEKEEKYESKNDSSEEKEDTYMKIKQSDSLKSTLLYLETCLADYGGEVEAMRMNDQDFDNIELMENWGILEFERLKGCPSKIGGRKVSHKVRFSDKAWELAHHFRKERGERKVDEG